MSHALMTIEDAGRHLGVSARTVRSYIGRSLLATTRVSGSRRKWLHPEEVEELRKDKVEGGARSQQALQRELLELRAATRRLRGEMDLVLRILDAHEEPLRLTPETARTLHSAAVAELGASAWDTAELTQWADVFLRLQEEDFLEVQHAVEGVPWAPFLRLCVAMTVHARSLPEYATSVELQMVHHRLTEARRRLRVAALCFTDMYGGAGEDAAHRELQRAALLDAPDTVRESLLRRAQRKTGPATP